MSCRTIPRIKTLGDIPESGKPLDKILDDFANTSNGGRKLLLQRIIRWAINREEGSIQPETIKFITHRLIDTADIVIYTSKNNGNFYIDEIVTLRLVIKRYLNKVANSAGLLSVKLLTKGYWVVIKLKVLAMEDEKISKNLLRFLP